MKEHGFCTYCKVEKARPGRVLCEKCAEKRRNNRQEKEKVNAKARFRRHMRRQAGLCPYCGKEAMEGFVVCQKHRQQYVVQHERYKVMIRPEAAV